MITFCNKVLGLKVRLVQQERGALAIEHALFSSAASAGCLALSTELATTIEHGLRLVNQVMP
jgi:Flp pilus assembly pilin Flp